MCCSATHATAARPESTLFSPSGTQHEDHLARLAAQAPGSGVAVRLTGTLDDFNSFVPSKLAYQDGDATAEVGGRIDPFLDKLVASDRVAVLLGKVQKQQTPQDGDLYELAETPGQLIRKTDATPGIASTLERALAHDHRASVVGVSLRGSKVRPLAAKELYPLPSGALF